MLPGAVVVTMPVLTTSSPFTAEIAMPGVVRVSWPVLVTGV